ncbi:histidine phosphatase family protein [Staphylococcus condimenti]|uniref:Histidine phosphatase family protein n=1 Tax=Staphylococcus condimenti TaxID=70255 RepID=A0A143PC58_9STAP|nr:MULTISPECIES: histidine phosphatase family protein [Staphylococcus]AMY05910.1 phosphoglycerate mutase [Staphylococcus condimenti]APR59775.1 histidine phosphatase family protein [Staphylococcus condimenti]MDK8644899.1 histidine phosphatase family protein [Staphylococcus condimenti]OFP03055.1 phosphoglycerate mutase [Staphylococcus sp. HMSC065E08]PNZ58823.1 histidine phosphatase family protein [Staphylococcus condimenti]
MTQTLYLIRHGQTLFNQKKQIQGASDSPLTELGKAQAEKAKCYLNQLNLNDYELFSSTQERASDTLEILFPNEPYTRLKGIKEWNYGMFEGESELLNPPREKGVALFGKFFANYGGETADEVQERAVNTLTDIMKQTPKQNVITVSHGDVLMLFTLKWLPIEEVEKMYFGNCCILKFEYEDSEFKFMEIINPI